MDELKKSSELLKFPKGGSSTIYHNTPYMRRREARGAKGLAKRWLRGQGKRLYYSFCKKDWIRTEFR